MIESKVVMKAGVKEDEYPKLMVIKRGEENAGTVVRFVAPEIGIVIHAEGWHKEFETVHGWNMDIFAHFHDAVVLTNK